MFRSLVTHLKSRLSTKYDEDVDVEGEEVEDVKVENVSYLDSCPKTHDRGQTGNSDVVDCSDSIHASNGTSDVTFDDEKVFRRPTTLNLDIILANDRRSEMDSPQSLLSSSSPPSEPGMSYMFFVNVVSGKLWPNFFFFITLLKILEYNF